MNFFSTNLLLHSLRRIVHEIELQNNVALVQLKRTIAQKSAEVGRSGTIEDERARVVGAA